MGSQIPSPPLRLAILMCDTPLPGTVAKLKDYGGVFTDLFRRAVAPQPLESALSITTYHVRDAPDSYPSLDEVDALLITGSKHSAYDDDPWILKLVEYVRGALDSGRVRVVGVCFGHQIVGRALGSKVQLNPRGWELSVTEIQCSPKGRELFGTDKLRIHQMHRDIVTSYPAGAVPLAETDVCPVQGMLIPGKAITVQGHPEFTESIVREILDARHKVAVIGDDLYESGIDRVDKEHDGVKIAQAFLRFMRGEE
ncbi:GMP synthase [Pleurostoma richardsiae]|uniref:GMP synthase n=1 Tax=Pleurostoma richardsiae TaxID=41990 RepID=A0AA38VLC7_9PEZI|nr:GMP synthase [Pleurostoma richardsiae]